MAKACFHKSGLAASLGRIEVGVVEGGHECSSPKLSINIAVWPFEINIGGGDAGMRRKIYQPCQP